MTNSSKFLQRVLAALVGLVLGVLGSALIMLWGFEGWPLLLPPIIGLAAGAMFGDRGIHHLARALSWF
jgi:hypothetical protein